MANFNQTLDTIYAGGLAAELDEKLTEATGREIVNAEI